MTLPDPLLWMLAAGLGACVGCLLTLRAVRARERSVAVAPRTEPTAVPPHRHRAATPPDALPRVAADVLVVDDSAVARAKLRRLLELQGYSVHVACDGVEALERLSSGRYALMISDLEMPRMDGVELINTCVDRALTAHMPILAVSGHENLCAKFNACRDVSGVHRKPWVDDVLVSHVAALVGARKRRPVVSTAVTA
jgi:CheY-like chemotaxis protein